MPEAPDWDALYRDHIHPAFAVPQGGQDRPRCVFLTDPQGSSKTTILRRLSAELGHDVTQSIVPDALLARIDTHHAGSPLRDAAVQAYRTTHCATHCQCSQTTPSAGARISCGNAPVPGRTQHLQHFWPTGPRCIQPLPPKTAPPGRRTTFTPSTAICAT